MRRLRSGPIGSTSAWLPSRRSTLHQRGARVMTRDGHVRSGRGIGVKRTVVGERHRSRRTCLRRHGCSPYVSASGRLRRAPAPDGRAVSPCCSLLQRSGAPSQGGGARRSGKSTLARPPRETKKPLRASERLWARAETARAYVRRRLELSALISFMLPGILHALPTLSSICPRACKHRVRSREQMKCPLFEAAPVRPWVEGGPPMLYAAVAVERAMKVQEVICRGVGRDADVAARRRHSRHPHAQPAPLARPV